MSYGGLVTWRSEQSLAARTSAMRALFSFASLSFSTYTAHARQHRRTLTICQMLSNRDEPKVDDSAPASSTLAID